MKSLLLEYARYNLWANTTINESIILLNHEQQHREVTSSFSSLYKTIFHVWGAEKLWLMRLNLEQPAKAPPDEFNHSAMALAKAWKELDQQWIQKIEGLDNEALLSNLTYRNLKGDQFSQPVYQIIHHLFNHGTYHRGQLVTMLRQVGLEKIPSTDFIAWARIIK